MIKMNKKEHLLKAKIKRRNNKINKLEIELQNLAEKFYYLPENKTQEKKDTLNKMKKCKEKIEKLNAEKKQLIAKIIEIPDL